MKRALLIVLALVASYMTTFAQEDTSEEIKTLFGNTQKQSIGIAQDIARNQHSDTKIHGRNGQIRAGNSYGNDPCPPKDKR